MTAVSDMDLVREYARHQSEEAFAELVHRHINLVYSVALRRVYNAHSAQDITQAVFIALARKASKLGDRISVSGWLYETTRLTAACSLRAEARRRLREQNAMQADLNEVDTDGVWAQLAPLLEEAMGALKPRDRELLVLRYFKNHSGTETAALLGINEVAARKRAGRAIEKLRGFFVRRGIRVSAGGMAAAVSANSVHAAPMDLANTVSVVALTKGATASTSTLTLVKGALKIMAWTKFKTAVVTSAVALLVAGTATIAIKQIREKADGFHFEGYSTPEASMQSMFWAASQGDVKGCLADCTPKQIKQFEGRMAGKSDAEVARETAAWANALKGYKITGEDVISTDEVHIHISAKSSFAGLHGGYAIVVMRKVGNDWKQDGDL